MIRTIELRIDDITARTERGALTMRDVVNECRRRGLQVQTEYDHSTQENVLLITGEASALGELEARASSRTPPSLPPAHAPSAP